MSDKMIRIKVSKIRALVREALGEEASTVTSRQTIMTADDSKKSDEKDELLNDLQEVYGFDELFVDKLNDKKYESMAKQIFDAWSERGVDVDWLGVVNLFARNHSKNLAQEVDKTKLYEKVLNLVELQGEVIASKVHQSSKSS